MLRPMPNQKHRHVRLFRNGRNQAVRIPREFELSGEEAVMRKEGERLIIEPLERPGLMATLAVLKPLKTGMPDIDAGLRAADDIQL